MVYNNLKFWGHRLSQFGHGLKGRVTGYCFCAGAKTVSRQTIFPVWHLRSE